MVVDVEQIDPRNVPALRAWWEAGRAATAERPGHPWPAWEHSRRALAADNPEAQLVLVAAIDGREMPGAGMLTLFREENPHLAFADLHVVPMRRREGIGRALLAELEALTRGSGRTTVQGVGYLPLGGTSPVEGFAAEHGYVVANREVVKELAVHDYLRRREVLRADVAAAAHGYLIVTFDTVCPQEHVVSFGGLLATGFDEMPLGELDLRSSAWSPERLRAVEEGRLSIGRHALTALALAPDGTVVGASTVMVNEAEPDHGQVGLTLVAPAHRGHRLGLALKLATHDLLSRVLPDWVSVDTFNAESNTHMNAVNEALGYRTIETLLELQRRL